MVTYPIHVSRNRYRGGDKRKQAKAADDNRIAVELEEHINRLLLAQTQDVKVYDYSEISRDTGYSEKTVRDHCFSIAGGHNGFTATKAVNRNSI